MENNVQALAETKGFQFNNLHHFKETMDLGEEMKRGSLLGDKQETKINEDMKEGFRR